MESCTAWMEKLRSNGLQDVLILSPAAVKDHNLLAFAGGSQFGVVCRYAGGRATFWSAHWVYDQQKQGWNITYQESLWPNAPKERPALEDPTPGFASVLEKIGALAEKLDEHGFANCFSKAGHILTGTELPAGQLIRLPEPHARLFAAADAAWVFGGMCSWNDSPPFVAMEGTEKVPVLATPAGFAAPAVWDALPDAFPAAWFPMDGPAVKIRLGALRNVLGNSRKPKGRWAWMPSGRCEPWMAIQRPARKTATVAPVPLDIPQGGQPHFYCRAIHWKPCRRESVRKGIPDSRGSKGRILCTLIHPCVNILFLLL